MKSGSRANESIDLFSKLCGRLLNQKPTNLTPFSVVASIPIKKWQRIFKGKVAKKTYLIFEGGNEKDIFENLHLVLKIEKGMFFMIR